VEKLWSGTIVVSILNSLMGQKLNTPRTVTDNNECISQDLRGKMMGVPRCTIAMHRCLLQFV